MSVLTDLSIAYESLPGEPSFYATAHHTTPAILETPQSPLSLPYIAQSAKPRTSISNFEFSPSFSTRQTMQRTSVHETKQSRVAPKPAAVITKPATVATEIKKTIRNTEKTNSSSRGMFNEFERASLLSYMQRRQFS